MPRTKTKPAPRATTQTPADPDKMLKEIYKLSREVSRKRAAHDAAASASKATKAALEEAQERLEEEIREQIEGPGPLFNGKPLPEKKAQVEDIDL